MVYFFIICSFFIAQLNCCPYAESITKQALVQENDSIFSTAMLSEDDIHALERALITPYTLTPNQTMYMLRVYFATKSIPLLKAMADYLKLDEGDITFEEGTNTFTLEEFFEAQAWLGKFKECISTPNYEEAAHELLNDQPQYLTQQDIQNVLNTSLTTENMAFISRVVEHLELDPEVITIRTKDNKSLSLAQAQKIQRDLEAWGSKAQSVIEKGSINDITQHFMNYPETLTGEQKLQLVDIARSTNNPDKALLVIKLLELNADTINVTLPDGSVRSLGQMIRAKKEQDAAVKAQLEKDEAAYQAKLHKNKS